MAYFQQNRFNQTRAVRQSAPKAARAASVVFSKLAKATSYSDPTLAENWPTIVGSDAASLCRPGRLLGNGAGRTLEIVVQHSSGATAAQMQADHILRAVNRYLGPNAVDRITIRQSTSTKESSENNDVTTTTGPVDKVNDPLGAALSSFRAAVSTTKPRK